MLPWMSVSLSVNHVSPQGQKNTTLGGIERGLYLPAATIDRVYINGVTGQGRFTQISDFVLRSINLHRTFPNIFMHLHSRRGDDTEIDYTSDIVKLNNSSILTPTRPQLYMKTSGARISCDIWHAVSLTTEAIDRLPVFFFRPSIAFDASADLQPK
ncbi:hypothetical protein SODALDRAFT_360043 [Sodiomyces alkalinus F11]|uniref:Uncharacterized protein n=1 Tax=Sodiomyces alkalinus (strain CBS 110278 / VKM F-3762 / F11) TaxID=1314773 RepID=A0A3N2PTE6_SODAK|nr:hypothetical protein SODALDRAFT_360043 [Sodiomyces alkalinus F11]ROT37751.1 hypothetical protein SODALDRAFT_360043 [Sodiomyces alkalinus F11]